MRFFSYPFFILLVFACAPAQQSSSNGQIQSGVSGLFSGVFECERGVMGVDIKTEIFESGQATAIFSFYPTPENSAIAQGSFRMRGIYTKGNLILKLQASDETDWIVRPIGYNVMSLDGFVTSAKFFGVVLPPNKCKIFSLDRK